MGKQQLPDYVQPRRGSGGGYRWEPSRKLKGWKGFNFVRADGAFMTFEEMVPVAEAYNRKVRAEIVSPAASIAEPKHVGQQRTIGDLIDSYLASTKFAEIAPNTQRDYSCKLRYCRTDKPDAGSTHATQFGRTLVQAVGKPEVRDLYDYLFASRGHTTAIGAIHCLGAAFAWAGTSSEWRLTFNPCHRLKLPSPEPRIRVASEAEIIALLEAADALGLPSIGDAIIIALYTCQREGDVLRLTERNGGAGGNRSLAAKVADGEPILFRPHKTRKKNNTAVKAWPDAEGVLARRLGEAEARRRAWSPPRSHKGMRSDYIRSLMSPPSPIMAMGAIVMRERTGLAWNAKSFGKEFSRVRAEAAKACPSLLGADGELALHFQDLRDTGLTRLARGGANPLEIADLSGHAPATVTIILKHYVEMDGELGRQAVQKRDAYLKRAGISF